MIFLARVAMVVLTILALGVSGIGAAERLFVDEHRADSESEESIDQIDLVPGANPEEATDGVATSGRPWTEQAACLQSPLLLPAGNDQARFYLLRAARRADLPDFCCYRSPDGLLQTPCQVWWSLGRQFTLVGAKPSGTS